MASADQHQRTPWRLPVTKLHIHNAIVDRLDLSPGDVLLDLGCGNGLTMATAATRVTNLSLIGVDVDAASLESAAEPLGDKGTPGQATAARRNRSGIRVPDRCGLAAFSRGRVTAAVVTWATTTRGGSE